MTDDDYCPMCQEYYIHDDYIVMKKEELVRDYIPISKIEDRIKELEYLQPSRQNWSDIHFERNNLIQEPKELLEK